MNDAESRREEAARWIERATFRLAECEAEILKLPPSGAAGRRRKLADRCERYRALLRHLGGEAAGPDRDGNPEREMAELERELASLKEQIRGAATALVRARARIREIRSRWSELADRVAREREARGEGAGEVVTPAFDVDPVPPGAAEEERGGPDREAHRLLRDAGL